MGNGQNADCVHSDAIDDVVREARHDEPPDLAADCRGSLWMPTDDGQRFLESSKELGAKARSPLIVVSDGVE